MAENNQEDILKEENMAENAQEETNAKNKEQESKIEEIVEKTPEEKYQELYNEYLRLMADFDNYRKRTIKERADLIKSAGADTIKAILPVLDDLDRAISAAEKTQSLESLKEGIDLIHKKTLHTLKEKGLEVMETIGKDFDVEAHEAITNIPAANEAQKGKVIEEIEKGYLLQGKVIRYAKVVVAI